MDGTIQDMDRTTQLPEALIHHIQSFLSRKEGARTTVLSKAWLRAWSTDPALEISEKDFIAKELRCNNFSPSFDDEDGDPKILEAREKFLNFVDKTLVRYDEQGIPMRMFSLSVNLSVFDPNWDSLIEKWIEILMQNHVKELELKTKPPERRYYYHFFEMTLDVMKSFTWLSLRGCRLKKAPCEDALKSHPLQTLCLDRVFVDEKMIHHIMSTCPLIEQLVLDNCYGLTRLLVANLHKLKKVVVRGLVNVEINAPSLEFVGYSCKSWKWRFNIVSSSNLKVLLLEELSITDKFFHNFMLKFPALEELALEDCNELRSLIISGHALKKISLCKCKKLMGAKIDAPSLFSFKYESFGYGIPSLCFTSAPRQWEATIHYSHGDTFYFASFLCRLRKFVSSLNQYAGVLTVEVHALSEREGLFEMDVQAKPLEVEHLNLVVFSPLKWHGDLLDSMFRNYHPKILLVTSCDDKQPINAVIKSLCEVLLESRVPNGNCWRRLLKNVEIGSIGGTKVERALHGKTLVDLLPSPWKEQYHNISFKLKW